MNPVHEVVVTGMGVVSPIGIGVDSFWDALISGKSGVETREGFEDSDSPIRIAAAVKDFDPKLFIRPRKSLKIMCDPIQYGCAAANIAFDQAGFTKDSPANEALDRDRLGIVFGTETFFANPNEVARVFRSCTVDEDYQHDRWGEFAMRQIQPLWMLKYLPNMAASHISIANDARGPSNSICQGEASGLLSVIEAAGLIQRGAADVVIAGGTGSQMALTSMLYRGVEHLSKRVQEPEKASRPFDANRDGMVVGEGSGVVILESREHAEARNARIIAKLSGWSRSYCSRTAPNRQAAIEGCIRGAAENAGVDLPSVGLYCANADGSVVGDQIEAKAIRAVLDDVPVAAFKSHFGNVGPGTSLLELIGGLLALDKGVIPPALNCEDIDPDCQVNVGRTEKQLESKKLIKTSSSATGQLASVVFESMK